MTRFWGSAGLLALMTTGTAMAGGIERSAPSVSLLFEEGRYGEFSYGYVNPSVSGTFGAGTPSGDMAPGYSLVGFGYKQDFGDNLDFALVVDQPVGADVAYPTGTGYPFTGATAEINSIGVAGYLRYSFSSNLSILGGIRAQRVNADLALPTGGGPYALSVPNETDFGYALGIAYEKPEIALRVALTYFSEITHTLSDNSSNPFDVVIPQSVNLDFQTGIAANTLLFGQIRWAEWTAFDISPPEYGASLASGTSDVTTYTLGIGRRFNENWSGAVTIGYEAPDNQPAGNLAPTDGYKSIGIGATYTQDNMKITAGLRYVDIGDTTTSTIGASFTGNSAIAAGVKVGFTF